MLKKKTDIKPNISEATVPVGHIWKFDLEKSRKHLILE